MNLNQDHQFLYYNNSDDCYKLSNSELGEYYVKGNF